MPRKNPAQVDQVASLHGFSTATACCLLRDIRKSKLAAIKPQLSHQFAPVRAAELRDRMV